MPGFHAILLAEHWQPCSDSQGKALSEKRWDKDSSRLVKIRQSISSVKTEFNSVRHSGFSKITDLSAVIWQGGPK